MNYEETSRSVARIAIKTEPFKLPRFNGVFHPIKFYKWWHQYKRMVHNADVSDEEKLLHLEECLSQGSALRVIEPYRSSVEAYNDSIRALFRRYGQREDLLNAVVGQIMNAEILTRKDLTVLNDILQELLNLFSMLGECDFTVDDRSMEILFAQIKADLKNPATQETNLLLSFLTLKNFNQRNIRHIVCFVKEPTTTV